jgi:hypothetical protein
MLRKIQGWLNIGTSVKRRYAAITAIVLTTIAFAFVSLYPDKNRDDIKFELRKNIVETARRSGVPAYSTRNIEGFISYSVNDLPPDISAKYIRPGYEVGFSPLFAFTMYADQTNQNNLGVEKVTLQFSTKPFTSHEGGKQFAEQVIGQMSAKKWARHIAEDCPAVTGRSAFMNADGKLERLGVCPLDPAYTLTLDEWIHMMRLEQTYEWIGDGVLATFRIAYSEDSRGITYNFFMEFDDFAVRERKNEQRLLLTLNKQDQKGWKSTEKLHQYEKSRRALIKVLEAKAIERGDPVVRR